jgi:ribonucleotide reductase alpha subunit
MTDPKEGLLDLGVAEGIDKMNVPTLEPEQSPANGSVRRYGYIPKEKFENINKGKGIRFHRLFTKPGIDPFDTVEWEKRTAVISGERGEVVFEQKEVEVPTYWSQLATNVVASKYFRGQLGTPERESSVKQLIGRVVETLAKWGHERHYFATEEDTETFREELKHLLLYQYAAFNSPVWFNVGIEPRPQCSACFIVSAEDTMESILDLAKTEGMIFKFGSGSGSNLSTIRGSREYLSGGGHASGPVSFMRGFDSFAGVIKCLTPDSYIYTDCGMQRLDEVIHPELPAGFHEDDSIVLSTLDGPTRISHVYRSPEAETLCLNLRQTGLSLCGTKEHPILTLTPDFHLEWKRLADLQSGDRVAVSRRTEMWAIKPPSFQDFQPVKKAAKKTLSYPTEMTPELARLLGYMVSEGCMDDERFRFINADEEVFNDFLACVKAVFGVDPIHNVSSRVNSKTGVKSWTFSANWKNAVRFLKYVGLSTESSASKTAPWSIRFSPRTMVIEFIRAYFEGDGHVSTHVYAASASKRLLHEIQLLLLNMGMVSQLRPHPVNGKTYWCLYLRGEEAWKFVREIGFISSRKRSAHDFAGDKNTNVDVVPFLVNVIRSYTNRNGYFRCSDGKTRLLSFGFFNRRPESDISYNRLRNTPGLLENLYVLDPTLAETVKLIMEREFFWDAVGSVEKYGTAVTYDFTVPETHSFVANGIINHNSGGKTRRAAKMVVLNDDHPDIVDFIECKAREERKAWALIEEGYDPGFNVPGGAYDSVFFQNANHSVRVSDAFMRAVEQNREWETHARTDGRVMGRYKARDLFRKIAESAWICGDPGLQFHDITNKWHTCSNTAPINASNPCCITGDTLIAVADGRNAAPIRDLVGQAVPVYAWDHHAKKTIIAQMNNIGIKRKEARVFRVTLDDGSSFRATDDHLIMLRDGSYRQVKDLKPGDSLNPFHSQVRRPADTRTVRRYIYTGKGWRAQYRWIWEMTHGPQPEGYHIHHSDFDSLNDCLDNLELLPADEHEAIHRNHMLGDNNPARRFMNDAWRSNIARAVQGEKNPHYGKSHSPEARAKMRESSAKRWSNLEQRAQAAEKAKEWMTAAREEGKRIGRIPGIRYERCCPACRQNFMTAREEQIFCSHACRYSPLGLSMMGKKGGRSRLGRSPSPEHREKLRMASIAAARPEQKRKAAAESLRSRCLKAARLLMDAGYEVSLSQWNELRDTVRDMGAPHVPQTDSMQRFFSTDEDLREQAALYNHKVVSVEFDGIEDVYDGTVEGPHNFAIITGETPSPIASKTADFSGIFIHNSEYVFLDNSACNLASMNLMKFRKENGEFDIETYRHVVRTLITAQEIIVDNSTYPTEKISDNSHKYRPLGLGYANLGALLMSLGLPYNSDEGRAYAAVLTALMHGEANRQSAIMARDCGSPFPDYEMNREPMLNVMRMHAEHVDDIDSRLIPGDLLKAAKDIWADVLKIGEKSGFRNAQVTVIAPTGTISFFMDCDTTGIEPDIALVKYKSLVGGGMLKIVNNTLPMALRRLGYSQEQVEDILAFVDTHDTIEGAPHLREEHLPIFDCAFRPANGKRAIEPMGHVKMMAAAQPFLSGAISKTVNMPADTTHADIEDIYMQAWKLGLKAIAIYRDGSKRTQPLSTKKPSEQTEPQATPAQEETTVPVEGTITGTQPTRKHLSNERLSITHKFSIAGHEGYITVGMYDDGSPGEIFITMAKEGSVISGLMDAFATAISLALQYGVPLEKLAEKFSYTRFQPSGFTNNPKIPVATSIVDYIFRWLSLKFLPAKEESQQPSLTPEPLATTATNALTREMAGLEGATSDAADTPGESSSIPTTGQGVTKDWSKLVALQTDAPPCPVCGMIMVRSGACHQCLNCGTAYGCG